MGLRQAQPDKTQDEKDEKAFMIMKVWQPENGTGKDSREKTDLKTF